METHRPKRLTEVSYQHGRPNTTFFRSVSPLCLSYLNGAVPTLFAMLQVTLSVRVATRALPLNKFPTTAEAIGQLQCCNVLLFVWKQNHSAGHKNIDGGPQEKTTALGYPQVNIYYYKKYVLILFVLI